MTELAPSSADAKWTKPENLHITLKFLGEIAPAQVTDIQKTISQVAERHAAITADLESFGFLPACRPGRPDERRPRVLYIAASQEEKMRALSDDLEKALEPLGFAQDHRFKAHITLARLRSLYNLEQLKNKTADLTVRGTFTLENLVLFKSTLTPQGPVYAALHEAKLTL